MKPEPSSSSGTDRHAGWLADPEFPKSWYPVARSSTLKKGRHQRVRFLDRDWILFRGEDGRAGIVSRYCNHMGADLGEGCVRGQHLICPVHHWAYGHDGTCHAKIPQGLAGDAKLESLAMQEWAGIVFVFPAAVAAYELPRTLVPARARFSSTSLIDFPFNWLLPALNTFDPTHLYSVHNRELVREPQVYSENPDHLAIRFEARVLPLRGLDRLMKVLGFDTVDVTLDCWGGSFLMMRNHNTGIGAVIGVESRGPSSSRLYMTAFNICDEKDHGAGMGLRLKLEIGRMATTAFVTSDIPLFRGMRPHRGVLIPGRDDASLRFWKYFQDLPKVTGRHEN